MSDTTAATTEVSADTDDLGAFVEHGDRYLELLGEGFEDVSTTRSQVIEELGFAPSESPSAASDPMAELFAHATVNNRFVREVRDALLRFDPHNSGLVTAPRSVIDVAISEAGLDAVPVDTLAADQERAARVDAIGRIRSLDTLIAVAQARGDLDDVASLEAEREATVLDVVDPEVAHTYVVAKYFDGAFDDDVVGREQFAAVAQGARHDEILDWLADEGVVGDAASVEYERIVAAARFFEEDEAARNRLDAGNDDDGDVDNKFSAADGVAHVMALTVETEDPIEGSLRLAVIDGTVGLGPGFASELMWNDRDLKSMYEGGSILGPLDDDERLAAVDGFVRAQAITNLNPEIPQMVVPYIATGNDSLDSELRRSYAREAVRLELVDPTDPMSQTVAAMFAGRALEDLDPADQAALVGELSQPITLGTDGHVEIAAGLFAAALVVPESVELPDTYSVFYGPEGAIGRDRLAASTLVGLNDGWANGDDVTPATEAFVVGLFDHLPPVYGYSTWAPDGERYLGHELGNALGVVLHQGDPQAQATHAERLSEIFMTPEGARLLSANPTVVDPMMREQLIDTTFFGREPDVPDSPADVVSAPSLVYWTADDFGGRYGEGDSGRVIGDVAIDMARAQLLASGESGDLTFGEELRIRQIVATDQGQNLFGFSEQVDYQRRNQMVGLALANPDWDADSTFADDISGFDNPAVNAELAVLLAEAELGRELTTTEASQLRALGRSEPWIDKVGLGSGLPEQTQAMYLVGALDQGWTEETFDRADDLSLNNTLNTWLGRSHLGQFNNADRTAELAELGEGPTEDLVMAVVGDRLEDVPGGAAHPAIQGQIQATVDEINAHRADGTSVSVVPVYLNAGQFQAEMYLFETTNDDGDNVFVDLAGEHFSSVNDWYNHSRLPPGQVVFTGTTEGSTANSTFVSPVAGADYRSISFTTESYVDTFWEHAEPWVMGGVAVVGGVLLFFPPTALVGGGLVAATGVYQAGKGLSGLYQLQRHGADLDWSDPRVRGDVLQVVEGTLTAATAGGSAWAARSARAGNFNRWATNGLRGLNVLEGGYSVGSIGYQANQILTSDLPESEKWKRLGQLGFAVVGQGVAPIAIGRNLHRLPFTTANAYHPGVSQEAFDQARSVGITDPAAIAGYTHLLELDRTSASAHAVAIHNVNGRPHVTTVPPRLVGGGGKPSSKLPNEAGIDLSNVDLAEYVERTSGQVTLSNGVVVTQQYAVIHENALGDYVRELDLLHEAAGSSLDPYVRDQIESYITKFSGFDRDGDPVYRVPLHHFDPVSGESIVHGARFPGIDADVIAFNAAVSDARAMSPSANLDEISVVVLNRNNGLMPSCPHCSGILGDANIVGGSTHAQIEEGGP